METPTKLRERAREHRAAAQKSFDQCDTDGALTQWQEIKHAEELELQAQLVEQGGLAEFPALFNLRGERVRAKLVRGQYGPCWCIELTDGRVRFAGAFPARASTLERKGYREATELAPARVAHTEGYGRAGLAALRFYFERTDDEYSPDAVPGEDW